MGVNYYKGAAEAEDAMAVIAKWVSGNRKIRVVYHDGTAIDADVERGIIRIPRMACASGITEEALMLLRGRVYHEAGHVDESRAVPKSEYPNGAMFSIWNALEDRRMEHAEADKHPGARIVFKWNTEYYNRDIAGKISSGKVDAPLWEAMCALSFMVEGMAPMWQPKGKAKAYAEAAHDEFMKVLQCRDSRGTLELAKRIYDLLKKVNEDLNEEKQKPQDGDAGDESDGDDGKGGGSKKPKQGKKDGQGDKQDDGDEGEPTSSAAGDMDESDGEGDESDGEGDDSKDGEADKDGDSKDGEADKDGDSKDGESEDGEADKDGDSGDGKEDGDGDGDGDDKDGDKGGKGKGKGKDGEEGDGDGQGDDGAEAEGCKDGDGAGQGEGEGDGEGDGETSDDSESVDAKGNLKGGDKPYEMNDEEAQGGKGDGRTLDEEVDGVSQEQVVNEKLDDLFKNMDPADMEYVSRRDLDQHRYPPALDEHKVQFKTEREGISVAVASMTQALEQALRSLTRCRRKPYLRQGKIDRKRLVAIAKGLSKEVFYRRQDGIDLDVAVAMVIDESGSMSNYRSVRLLAVAIGEALQAIGVPFSIVGSTTAYTQGDYSMPPMDGFTRTNPILYNHFKDFGEAWTVVRHRLCLSGAHLHNVDGEVVEHAAFTLAQRKERRKIVFSLSDGNPMAGHKNDKEMARNLMRVCKRVRKDGIEVYGFGVGTEAPRGLYGDKWFVFLDKTESMGPEFVRKFATVVTGGLVKV